MSEDRVVALRSGQDTGSKVIARGRFFGLEVLRSKKFRSLYLKQNKTKPTPNS